MGKKMLRTVIQRLAAIDLRQSSGTPSLGSMASIAGILEVVGGALLVLGLFTGAIAFLLSGEMAVAYFVAHAPNGFWPVLNGGALAALNCCVFLYLSVAGAGPRSSDGVRASSAPSTETARLPG